MNFRPPTGDQKNVLKEDRQKKRWFLVIVGCKSSKKGVHAPPSSGRRALPRVRQCMFRRLPSQFRLNRRADPDRAGARPGERPCHRRSGAGSHRRPKQSTL